MDTPIFSTLEEVQAFYAANPAGTACVCKKEGASITCENISEAEAFFAGSTAEVATDTANAASEGTTGDEAASGDVPAESESAATNEQTS